MANRTVEFISDQYGKMVFANAASESTMRELLNAIGDLEDNIDDVGGGSPVAPVVNSVKKSGNKIKGLAGKVEKWGRTTTKDFANLMEKGSNKTSEWAGAVNDNFVKTIPVVGEALGGLADSLIMAISIFEGWNDVLAQTSKYGASFNNSILELRRSAAIAHMDLEAFASLITKNSQRLTEIGGTATKGSKLFARYTHQLWEGKKSVVSELLNLGFTSDDIANDFMFYFTNVIRSTKENEAQYKKQTASFAEYAKNQQFIAMMTGRSRDQQQQGMMEALRNDNFRRHLDTLGQDKREKTLKALSWADGIFKESGREYVMASSMGQQEMAELGNKLATYSPNSKKMLDELLGLANSSAITAEQFDEASKDIIAKYIPLMNSDIEALKAQLDGASANYDGMEDMVKATEGLREFLNNFGAVNSMTTEQIKAKIKKIQEEAKRTETFTQAMNEMSAIIRKFKDEVMVDLVPYFEELGKILKATNLPSKIEEYGKGLEALYQKIWDSVTAIFKFFSSDESDAFVKAYMELFARKMYLYAKLGVLKMSPIPTGILQDRVRREIAEVNRSQESLPSIAAMGQPDKSGIVQIVTPDGSTVTVARADLYKRIAEYAKQNMEIANIDVVDGQMVVSLRTRPGLWDRLTRSGYLTINKQSGEPARAIIDGMLKYETTMGFPGIRAIITSADGKVVARYDHIGALNTIVQGTNPSQTNRDFMTTFGGSEVKAGQVIGGYSYSPAGMSGGQPLPPTRPQLEVTADDGTVQKFNKGTLGEYGKLFRSFGSGTLAVLHNDEAVTTPAQQSSIMMKAGQFVAAEFIVNLNSNVKTLISLTKEELDFERAKVRALAAARVN